MPRRLTLFLITPAWLLTILIVVSITTRIAYASRIGFHETTDFWLELPLGKNAENEYILTEFEVRDWLLTDLDEIDVKETPSSYINIIVGVDSIEPSQIDVKKPSSYLLLFPFLLIIMLFITFSGLLFHDILTFKTVLHNCLRSDKSISWRRIKNEIGGLTQIVLKILLVIVCYILFSATCYIAFNDILLTLTHQEFMWNNQYGLIVLLFYFPVTFYFSVFKLSIGIFKGYKNRVTGRSRLYHSIDLHRLKKQMLDID